MVPYYRQPKNLTLFCLSIILLIISSLLLKVQVDRLSGDLQPDEGITHGLVLTSDSDYQQSFLVNTKNISKLGLFIRPAVPHPPTSNLSIKISREAETIFSQTINSALIDSSGPTYLKPSPPISTTPGEKLVISITVPEELSGSLRLQHRLQDESFNADTATLYINHKQQPNPLAYQTFFSLRPPLAIQLALVLISLSLTLIFLAFLNLPKTFITQPLKTILRDRSKQPHTYPFIFLVVVYLLFAPGAFLFSFNASPSLIILYFYCVATFIITFLILIQAHLSLLPSVFGCHTLVFTSWYPLQLFSHRPLAGLLTILILFITLFAIKPSSPDQAAIKTTPANKLFNSTVIFIILALISLFVIKASFASADFTSNPRDIFLDPDQSLLAIKVTQVTWDRFGSYVGIIPLGFALIGLVTNYRKNLVLASMGLIGLIFSCWPPASHLLNSFHPWTAQYLIIATTVSLAIFSAFGIRSAMKFLAPTNENIRLNPTLIIFSLITIISLFDLWHVSSTIQ